ncbi:MAG TPA: hypothetical protein VGH99_17355 [Pseudonocardia sp.]|jgi:hypothetical protein
MVFRDRPSRHRAVDAPGGTTPDQELESFLAAITPEPDPGDAESTGRLDSAQVFPVRLPELRIEQLRRLAVARGIPAASLVRDWVLERLDREDPGFGPAANPVAGGAEPDQFAATAATGFAGSSSRPPSGPSAGVSSRVGRTPTDEAELMDVPWLSMSGPMPVRNGLSDGGREVDDRLSVGAPSPSDDLLPAGDHLPLGTPRSAGDLLPSGDLPALGAGPGLGRTVAAAADPFGGDGDVPAAGMLPGTGTGMLPGPGGSAGTVPAGGMLPSGSPVPVPDLLSAEDYAPAETHPPNGTRQAAGDSVPLGERFPLGEPFPLGDLFPIGDRPRGADRRSGRRRGVRQPSSGEQATDGRTGSHVRATPVTPLFPDGPAPEPRREPAGEAGPRQARHRAPEPITPLHARRRPH